MMKSDWQAIIFDFDGVLVESCDIKTRAFADLYSHHGDAVVTAVLHYHQTHFGISRYEKFRYIQTQLLGKPPLTPDEEREMDCQFSRRVVDAVVDSPAVAGSEQLLQTMAGALPLFIASGTPQRELEEIVMRRGMSPYFTGIYGSPVRKAKLVAEIMTIDNLQPDKVLMIGDAIEDYHSASANDIAFLGRVPEGCQNPFPYWVRTVCDLTIPLNEVFQG